MESLDIIPFNIHAMERKVAAFQELDQVVKHNFAEILLATMDVLYKLHGNLKSTTSVISSPFGDGGKEQVKDE